MTILLQHQLFILIATLRILKIKEINKERIINST